MDLDKKNHKYQYAINLLRSLKLIKSKKDCDNIFNNILINYTSQVELQPGSHCDLFNCPHCYGKSQELEDGILELHYYKKLLDEIEEEVPLIQVSGVATEPLTYPHINDLILEIKKRKFQFGLHTKGLRLTPELNQILTDDYHGRESFVTLSIDAANSKDYLDVHDIRKTEKNILQYNTEDYFYIVLNNIRNLFSLKQAKKSIIKINLAYLLFEKNCSKNKLDDFVRLFSPYCDVIRFSLPQISNVGNAPGFLSDKEEMIKSLRERYRNNPKIYILQAIDTAHNTFFNQCYAQRYQAVIDKIGNVFPCPQTALKEYKWLSYGNIKKKSFNEIICSDKRMKLFYADIDSEMKCRLCDRKDEDINITIDRLLS